MKVRISIKKIDSGFLNFHLSLVVKIKTRILQMYCASLKSSLKSNIHSKQSSLNQQIQYVLQTYSKLKRNFK